MYTYNDYIYIYRNASGETTLHKAKGPLAATPCGMTFETTFFSLSCERSSSIHPGRNRVTTSRQNTSMKLDCMASSPIHCQKKQPWTLTNRLVKS